MQLANSTTVPTDPNLLALLFGGANTPGTAALAPGAGFESLLTDCAPAAGEPVAAAPVALGLGGVPLAFFPLPTTQPGATPVKQPGVGEGSADPLSLADAGEETITTPLPLPGTAQPKRGARGAATGARAAVIENAEQPATAESAKKSPEVPAVMILPQFVPVVPATVVDLTEPLGEESAETPGETPADETAESPSGDPATQRSVAEFAPQLHAVLRRAPLEQAVANVTPLAADGENSTDKPATPDSATAGNGKPAGSEFAAAAEKLVAKLAFHTSAKLETLRPDDLPAAALERRATPALPVPEHFTRVAAEPATQVADAAAMTPEIPPRIAARNDREKLAAALDEFADVLSEEDSALEKTFVSAANELVAMRRRPLGTEAANSPATMPASTSYPTAHAPVPDVSSALVSAPGGLPERIESHNVLALQLDGVSSAHQAVEVVLRTADRLSSLVHKSVRLEFSVGGEQLDVRVELRSNEVRTTFHTESAELRTALASEWQAVAASSGSGERTLRILPAEFGGSPSANGFSGDASSRQRDAHAQQQAEAAQSFSFGGRGRPSRATRGAGEVPAADPSFAAPGTALHLHTLA